MVPEVAVRADVRINPLLGPLWRDFSCKPAGVDSILLPKKIIQLVIVSSIKIDLHLELPKDALRKLILTLGLIFVEAPMVTLR